MKGTAMGIDLAKNVFEIYVEEGATQNVQRKRLARKKLLPWLANRPPVLIGMEACGGAHYWALELDEAGTRGAADGAPARQAVGADQEE